MEYLYQAFDLQFFGNSVETYTIAFAILIGIFIFFRFFFLILFKKLEKYAAKSKTDIDDSLVLMFEKNQWIFFIALALLYIDITFKMPEEILRIERGIFNVVAVILGIRVANFWVQYGIEKIMKGKKNTAEEFSVRLVGKFVKGLVWIFGLLFLISSFGYNISSLVAGLGIGGLAVALAVQNILADLISYVSIFLDKPFQVGDYIVVGQQMGTVKNIGIKTTRITSLQGEEIIMSNKKLTESDINNYGRMQKRRVLITLGVTYDTPLSKMKKLPEAIKKIIHEESETTFDRAHFKSFGDFSKQFEIVFWIESKDYYTYMDRLQEINFKIQEYFNKQKIEFAFPSQTIYLEK